MSDINETTGKTLSTAIVKGSLTAFLPSMLAKPKITKEAGNKWIPWIT